MFLILKKYRYKDAVFGRNDNMRPQKSIESEALLRCAKEWESYKQVL